MTTNITTDIVEADFTSEECEHRWRVTSFEATTQIVGHRCERCGVTTLEKPEPGVESRP